MRTASLLISLVALLVAPACGKSTCEKYADMEVKCGQYPENEKDITHDLSQGFCMAANSDDDPEAKEMAAHFKAEAECATKTSDCLEYKACTSAIK
jgi:hypothetical protein